MNNTSSSALPPVALRIFDTLPGQYLVLSPQLTILTASNRYLKFANLSREDITNRSLADVFSGSLFNWSDEAKNLIIESLQQVVTTQFAEQLSIPGAFSEPATAPVEVLNHPVADDDGAVAYVIHEIRSVPAGDAMQDKSAETIRMKEDAETGQHDSDMQVLFDAVPAQIAILRGPDLTYSYINPQYKRELFPHREVLGMPLLAALPEISNDPIVQILYSVYHTGKPYIDTEICVPLAAEAGGELEDHFFNVVYQPLRNEAGEIDALLSFKYEITQHVAARKLLEEKTADLEVLNNRLHDAYQELQAINEELNASNEELQATNEELNQAQDELAILNETLEQRILERTARLQDSEHEQQALNEELMAVNEELSSTNEELIDSRTRIEETAEQLAMSEQKIRSLVDSAPFPIGVYVGREMRIEMLNQAIIDTWNRGSDLIGKTYAEVLPELADTGVYEHLDRVYTTGIPYHTRNERVDLLVDGTLTPFYFNYDFTPLFDSSGKVYGVMNTAADVTDLANAKLQAEQSQKSLYNIIMRSPVAKSILLGAEYNVNVANDRMITLWGKSREEMMNHPIFEALPEAKGQGLEELLADVYNNGQTFEAKERAVSLLRNGSLETIYLDFVYQPYRDAHENIIGVIVTAIDVTSQVVSRERVQQLNEELAATNEELQSANNVQAGINEELNALNEALKLSQAEVQLAIDAAGLATFDLNPNTGRFAGNDMTKAWFGLQPADEIELEKAVAAIAEEDQERVQQAIDTAMSYASGGDYDIHYTIINPLDKVARVVRAKGKAQFNENREPIRLSGVLLDITEQKKDEQRKNDFIGIASHELKTPLTSLKALIQVTGQKLKTSEDQFLKNTIEKSGVQVKKMEAMINGFLNISRLESGKMAIEKTRFNLQTLIEEIIKETALTTTSHQIVFESGCPVEITADADKIESVISNLIGNAAKYSARGTNITVNCQQSSKHVTVSVTDQGMGITPEDQQRIFDRYFRVESSHSRHISGFGIGLYLSAEIIHLHKGEIGVTSEPGIGSTFYIRLPLDLD
ncbi:PAS domain-containing protein [Pedobacter sp. SYP-B3415]|uniref:PAS domain-containing protein n=1 Tax=Pedobacter sp. SYP-B3415 TaxID=2496641 RepID=UPI00101B86EE|nr:PAS domain-containing protein [Pedobacter sp. SYP-B3415]